MSEETKKLNGAEPSFSPPRRGRRRAVMLCGAMFAAGLVLAAAWLLQSRFLRDYMRGRILAAVESASGGRAEVRGFSLDLLRLEADLRGLVIHGKESPGEPPLVSIESVQARWKLLSAWNLRADLRRLRIEKPVVHVVVYEDGRTNLPQPKAWQEGSSLDRFLNLSIGEIEVAQGELSWNQRRWPLELRAENFHVQMRHEGGPGQYAGEISFHDGVLLPSRRATLRTDARARFRLSGEALQIQSAELRSGASRLAVAGDWRNFSSPQLRLNYDLAAYTADAGDLLPQRRLQGNLSSRGELRYSANTGWLLQGSMTARAPKSQLGSMPDVPWSAQADVRASWPGPRDAASGSWKVEFTKLVIATLGGSLAGSASLAGAPAEPVANAELQARNLSLPVLLPLVPGADRLAREVRWSASFSGPVHARFTGLARDLVVSVDWQAQPPAVLPPGFSPVSGSVAGTYSGRRRAVEEIQAHLRLPQTSVDATGMLAQSESRLHVAFATTSVEENRAAAALLWKNFDFSNVRLYGAMASSLVWTGGTASPAWQGDFRVTDFSYKDQRWNSFTGGFAFHKPAGADDAGELTLRDARLVQGTTTAVFSGNAAIRGGDVDRTAPFRLVATVRRGDARRLQDLAGLHYPVSARVDGSLNLAGTPDSPIGHGEVRLYDGEIEGRAFDSITAQLEAQPGRVLRLVSARVQKGSAVLTGSGFWDQPQRRFGFEASVSKFPIDSLGSLEWRGMPLSGVAQGEVSGQGTLEHPRVNASLTLDTFRLGKIAASELSVKVESTADLAQYAVAGKVFGGQMRATGTVRLQNGAFFTLNSQVEGMDFVETFAVFGSPPQGLQARGSGSVTAEGDLNHPQSLTVRGQLTRFSAASNGIAFENRGTAELSMQNDLLRLAGLHLVGEKIDLLASGTIRIARDPALDLTANGTVDLAMLGPRVTGLKTAGTATLDAEISGTLKRPQWRGSVSLADGSAQFGNFPNSITKIHGKLIFDGNRGTLDGVTAETGGGQLRIQGFVVLNGGGPQFNLTINAADVRIRYPEGLSTWLTGQLTWRGTMEASSVEGRLTITKQSAPPSFDLAQILTRRKEETSASEVSPLLQNMRLGIQLTSAPDIRLDTSNARNLQTEVDLRIQGTAEDPVWLGRIGILQGELEVAGKQYTVTRGEISFVNPFRLEPILNLSVQARVQQYDVSMDFSGPPDRLTVSYRSDPPLPTRDILSLLVAGRARDTSLESAGTQIVPQVNADVLLSQALSSQISSRLDRLFGAGRVRLDPQITGLGASTNASVVLQQQIRNDITITYITDVTSTQQQSIQAEWTINQKLSVVGIRDQNGLLGVNFQITLRFR